MSSGTITTLFQAVIGGPKVNAIEILPSGSQPLPVTVAPLAASLYVSQAQQFTASVANTTNTAVTWAASPAGTGTLSTSGLYTAPASIGSQQTITVTATSVADTTKSGQATITLNPSPAITSQPASATVPRP